MSGTMKYFWILCVVAALLGLITYAVAGEDVALPRTEISVRRVNPQTDCEMKMEAAMRAKDELDAHGERLHPKSSFIVYDGSMPIDLGWHGVNDMVVITIPDTRTEEQRLDDEERRIKKQRAELTERRKRDAERKRLTEENEAMHKAFTEQWTAVKKECWRKP